MDTHDHLTITPRGHENQGVHVCHKCGWAFPKLHPSAKQRRAHRRICGTIEGYKLIAGNSTISDDEPSDEDYRTPSPHIDQRRSISGSGGVGERSEDEVFSDAVAEFSDSGFSTASEEQSEKKNVQTAMVGDMGGIQTLKVDAISNSADPLSSLPEKYEVHNDSVTTNITPIHHNRTDKVAVVASSMNDSSGDFSLIKFEEPANAPRCDLNVHNGDDGKKHSKTCIMEEKHVTGKKDKVDVFLVDVEEPQNESVNIAFGAESDLQEIDSKSSYSVPTNGLEESTKSERVEAEMSVHGHPPLVEPVENMETFVNTIESRDTKRGANEVTFVQSVANDLPIVEHADIMQKDCVGRNAPRSDFSSVNRTLNTDDGGTLESPYTPQSINPDKTVTEFDCARAVDDVSRLPGPTEQMEVSVSTAHMKEDPIQDKDPSTCSDLFETCDTDKETMHVLTVVSDLPIVDHADTMLKGFKDHTTFRREFLPNLGSDDVGRPPEGDDEGIVVGENTSSLHSSKPDGVTNSLGDMNDMEEDMITIEAPDKGVADTFKLGVTNDKGLDSEGLHALPNTSRSEQENIQTNCHYEASPMISSHNDEVSQITRLSGGNKNNHNEMAQAEDVATDETESGERVPKIEHSTKANTNIAHEDSNQTAKLTRQNGSEHVEVIMEISEEAWVEKSTEAAAEEKFATATMTKLELEGKLLDSNNTASSPGTPVSSINTSVVVNVMPAHPGSRKFSGYDCQEEVTTEPEIKSETEVVAKCVDRGTVDSKFSHSGETEVAEDNSKMSVMEGLETSPIHFEIPHGSSAVVKTEYGSDDGVVSETIQESDGKLTKQPSGASAVDISVDSSSQTDSVEGNWGSVSVLSAQSDQPVFTGTEAQLKAVPEGHDKSESTTLHQEIALERQLSGKADAFEPPSFTTLVEPTGGSYKKVATSEIETVQSSEQPNSEALQAGWIPLLSNIVNESPGRKKNEEIIAKVTNWSTSKQHGSTPLKNLLGEAKLEAKTKSPSPKRAETKIRNDEIEEKSNVSSAAINVKDILGSEAPATADQVVKRETAEEWNSPAKYPVEIRKDKKKTRGKPSWVPFVCCSSVN